MVLAVLIFARAARALARLVGQPVVVGEIAVGLAIGPILLATAGLESFVALLPNPIVQTLQLITLAGLVLFLVGVAHEINAPRQTGRLRTVSFVGLGSLVSRVRLLAGRLPGGDPDSAMFLRSR